MAVQALRVLQGQQCRLWWRLHCGPLAHSQVHGLGLRAWCVWLEGRAAFLLDSTLAAHSTVRVQRRQQAQYKLQRLGSGLLLLITPT